MKEITKYHIKSILAFIFFIFCLLFVRAEIRPETIVTKANTYAVNVSSTTFTQLCNRNSNRVRIVIPNVDTFKIYVSTATDSSSYVPIKEGMIFETSYRGAMFIKISEGSTSTIYAYEEVK